METFFRWLLFVILVALLFIFKENRSLTEIEEEKPAVFYANQCHDNLHQLFLEAIESANRSIFLIIYSLNDRSILHALNKRANEGIAVTILHDPSTLKRGLPSPVITKSIEATGLMHKKILIVDESRVWLGSANWTRDSLKLDDNLVVGLHNPELAKAIIDNKGEYSSLIRDQSIEYWSFPQKGKEGLNRLISLIDQAKKSVYVSMFTWTHPQLTDAIIRAHARGVSVKVVLDTQTAYGASSKTCQQLKQAKVAVSISTGFGLLHHKHAWIDETILVHGSGNWTRAAFSRNWDYFLILYPLNETQQSKLKNLWRVMLANKKHLAILWQRPERICNPLFEPIGMFTHFT
ncbi:MAG: phospholipase D-like domain-containing protein [Chlamydiales bacterium]